MRLLQQDERSLLKYLMKIGGLGLPSEEWLGQVIVDDLTDGGMGSFTIVAPENRGFSHLLSEVEFSDADGVRVLASLYVDPDETPCEVDIWKVDFSTLISLPDFEGIS
ncbi:DUF6984 family protein [Luteibacter jiangsuensis]